jgi:hypothetical protein
MTPLPLPKGIYNDLKALGVERMELRFSGGSDEGYLDIAFYKEDIPTGVDEIPGLYEEIDKWAFDAYDYSGAGGGTMYGDHIEYDLKEMTASHTSWYTVEKYNDTIETPFEIDQE